MNITAVLTYPEALIFWVIHPSPKISLGSFLHQESQNVITRKKKSLSQYWQKDQMSILSMLRIAHYCRNCYWLFTVINNSCFFRVTQLFLLSPFLHVVMGTQTNLRELDLGTIWAFEVTGRWSLSLVASLASSLAVCLISSTMRASQQVGFQSCQLRGLFFPYYWHCSSKF